MNSFTEPDVGMPEKEAHRFFQQLIAAVVSLAFSFFFLCCEEGRIHTQRMFQFKLDLLSGKTALHYEEPYIWVTMHVQLISVLGLE